MRPQALLLAALLLPATAYADSAPNSQSEFTESVALENSNQVLPLRNQHLLEYLFVDVYSAALYAPDDAELNRLLPGDAPLRLELSYYRSIKRQDVIKAAWTALKRQYDENALAQLKPNIDELHSTLSDISDGDRYSLTRTTTGKLILRHNGKATFESDDRQLAEAYPGIWLNPNGLSDELRTALLN